MPTSETPERMCGNCGHIVAAGYHEACPVCGHVRQTEPVHNHAPSESPGYECPVHTIYGGDLAGECRLAERGVMILSIAGSEPVYLVQQKNPMDELLEDLVGLLNNPLMVPKADGTGSVAVIARSRLNAVMDKHWPLERNTDGKS